MTLSPAYQLNPEQSTAAIVVHHTEARYYTVGGSRLEQLEREMAKGQGVAKECILYTLHFRRCLMAERMVRTQIYLPPKVHVELKRRAEKHGLTLALQIREALEDYLELMKKEEEQIPPFDPTELFSIIDNLKGSGPPG